MTDSPADRFRSGFRRHAAGVAVVTAPTPDGPVGLTASSVASVSAEPPLLSFSVARTSTTAARLLAADRLAVHVLAAEQVAVATDFARRDGRRFAPEQGWSTAADGTPLLAGAVATFRGRVAQVVPAGGSWLVLVEVDGTDLGPEAAPLVHHDRAYWAPAPVVPLRLLG